MPMTAGGEQQLSIFSLVRAGLARDLNDDQTQLEML